MVHNNFLRIDGEEREWYPFLRLNSAPCHLFNIQTTPPPGRQAHVSALVPIGVVTMQGVAETFKTVINEISHGTYFKLVNMVHTENADLTKEDLNTSIEECENRSNILLVLYHTISSTAKPSSNGQLSYRARCFGSINNSPRFKTKHCVGW